MKVKNNPTLVYSIYLPTKQPLTFLDYLCYLPTSMGSVKRQ